MTSPVCVPTPSRRTRGDGPAALSLLALLVAPGIASAGTLSGTVLDEAGAPLKLAHVIVQSPGVAEVTAEVSGDGSFCAEVEAVGLVDVQISAVDHDSFSTQVYLPEGQAAVGVDARLVPYAYRPSFEGVMIIGSWSDYSTREAVQMTPLEDGTFVYEVEVEGAEAGYQLIKAVEGQGMHSINGTQASRFEYDGGGDYLSFVAVSDGVARIVFDPTRLVRGAGEPSLNVADPSSVAALGTQLGAALALELGDPDAPRAMADALSPELQARLQTHLKMARKAKDKESKALHAAAAFALVGAHPGAVQMSEKQANKALKAAPGGSAAWSLPGALAGLVAALPGDADAQALVQVARDQNVSGAVREQALRDSLEAAFNGGELALSEQLFASYMAQFAEAPAASFVVLRLNPAAPLRVGAALPGLEIAALDDAETMIRGADLEGKVWLLEFWATWCGPCVGEMPYLHAAYERFHDAGFEIVSVSLDEEAQSALDFKAAGPWSMPWTLAHGNFTDDAVRAFGVQALPTTALIDGEGRIIALNEAVRGENLELVLSRLQASGALSAAP